MSRRRARFRRGRRYRTVEGLVRAILAGRYVFLHGRPQHPGWLGSMSIATLRGFVLRGAAYVAIDTDPGRPSKPWSTYRRILRQREQWHHRSQR